MRNLLNFQVVLVVVVFVVGIFILFKDIVTLQSIRTQKHDVKSKHVRKLTIRLMMTSLILGLTLGSVLVEWDYSNGAWIALPCFGGSFLFGIIRAIKATS